MRREQSFPILRVFQRHRGVRGQFDQRRFIVGGEFANPFIDDFENAEHISRPSNAAAQRPAFEFDNRIGIDAAIDRIMHLARRNSPRFAGAQHFAHDAGIVGHSQLAARHAQRRPTDQHVVRPIPQKDARSIGFQ